MIWKTKNREFDLRKRGVIMGILNLTPDSFSDGGRFASPDGAVEHALRMEAEGAEIIDIGGESTRPGSDPVPEEEELARVIPVLEKLQGRLKAAISIDTYKPAVARAAMERGAEIINDITALKEPEMAKVAAETDAALVLTHMKGTPKNMQEGPWYGDLIPEVREFLRQRLLRALGSGIDPLRIALDPGIGFGKTKTHNLMLLRRLEDLRVEGRPFVLGVSRKSFLGKLTEDVDTADQRFWATVAMTSLGRQLGAQIIRVHDVKANVEALRVADAILNP
jgi:dihydropteroate synthase